MCGSQNNRLAEVAEVKASRSSRDHGGIRGRAKPHEVNFISVLMGPGTHLGQSRFGNESVQQLNEDHSSVCAGTTVIGVTGQWGGAVATLCRCGRCSEDFRR